MTCVKEVPRQEHTRDSLPTSCGRQSVIPIGLSVSSRTQGEGRAAAAGVDWSSARDSRVGQDGVRCSACEGWLHRNWDACVDERENSRSVSEAMGALAHSLTLRSLACLWSLGISIALANDDNGRRRRSCCSPRAQLLRDDWQTKADIEQIQLELLQLVHFVNRFRTTDTFAFKL